MAEEAGAVAVAEAPVAGGAEGFSEESASYAGSAEEHGQSVQGDDRSQGDDKPGGDDKQDGRRQPDALRKRIADLRKQAESVADPEEKARLLADAKELNNRVGKVAAYEQHFPTVREARETKALLESFGGREGLARAQSTLAAVQQIDQQLAAGDPAITQRLWEGAPEGMVKLAPVILSEFAERAPQEYVNAILPHTVQILDESGFPEVFDRMVQMFGAGRSEEAYGLAMHLAQWVQKLRESGPTNETRVDPRVEQLQRELDQRKAGENAQQVDRAYNEVTTHAGPVIDRYLRPMVGKLGLTQQQYGALRADVWNYLQQTRNADENYKTIARAKHAQGLDAASAYIKSETEARAQEAARARAHFWYGHQLKNGAVSQKNPTATPLSPSVTRGREPSPAEIDYGPKGVAVAKRQGFKDLGDMILAGKAPLKSGGIRQWR